MSSNQILLWGALPVLPNGETFEISYQRSGNNFGNTLIGNGVFSALKGYEYLTRSQLKTPEETNERCCHIVIPAANFLWKDFDFGEMADFIEATTIPVTIIGLGAQTNDRSMISKIHPNTVRLVKILSERSPSLGVRGFYTAEVLAAHGILNVEVLGCPSLYTMGVEPRLPRKIEENALNNISVNFSRRVAGHSFNSEALQSAENQLLNFAIVNNLKFVAQDELEELALSAGRATDSQIQSVLNYFYLPDRDLVIEYFKTKTNYFCNFDSWSGFIKERSGCIGSRLHGNIVATLNGIPSLTIAHDSRTLEMCALTGSPYIHLKDFVGNDNPNILTDALLNADYSLFVKNMRHLFNCYRGFLAQHNLNNIL